MKTQLDLSDIVESPEFSQQIEVIRCKAGRLYKGKMVNDTISIYMNAVVSPLGEKEIQMIPEGDRINESRTFHTVQALYTTKESSYDDDGRNADLIKYNGDTYKVTNVINAGDYGYWKVIGTKIGVDS